MPNSIAERTARKGVHEPLRKLAVCTANLRTQIDNTMRKHGLPANPYAAVLGDIEEYLNSCADEFDDPPEGPCLQSFEEAHKRVRAFVADEGPSKAYDRFERRMRKRRAR